jgi:hypothetical protein
MSAGGRQPASYSKVVGAGRAVRRRRAQPAHIDGLIRLVSVRIVRLSEQTLQVVFRIRFQQRLADAGS